MILATILIMATLACALVAGFLLAFAIVVMPGLRRLDDASFIQAFRAIDRVIQNGQPLFVLLWVGSPALLITAATMGWSRLDGPWQLVVTGAAVVNLLGVHIPTLIVNIPLNNRLQALRNEGSGANETRAVRMAFEDRWNRWNVVRTVVAVLVTLLLVVTLSSAAMGVATSPPDVSSCLHDTGRIVGAGAWGLAGGEERADRAGGADRHGRADHRRLRRGRGRPHAAAAARLPRRLGRRRPARALDDHRPRGATA